LDEDNTNVKQLKAVGMLRKREEFYDLGCPNLSAYHW
jgi:hypothetical protein